MKLISGMHFKTIIMLAHPMQLRHFYSVIYSKIPHIHRNLAMTLDNTYNLHIYSLNYDTQIIEQFLSPTHLLRCHIHNSRIIFYEFLSEFTF